jgi:hypothetical protein
MNEQTTLRDQLSAAFDSAPDDDHSTTTTVETPEVVAVAGETAEQTAQRLRDEKGRFAKGETQEQVAQPQVTTAPVVEAKPRPARPSTWKKDIVEKYWDAIDPELADYLQTREQQYAQGVSTYKQEWERAKPIAEAMQQFMPLLQQHNIAPEQWISNLGNAHRMLATGTPEQKAMWFQKLATDYGVQLNGNGGGDPAVAGFVNELQTLKQELNHFKTAAQRQEEARTQSEIATWSSGKPHFDKVRGTMAQLLESGVATDLQTAYDKAIRLHDDIFEEAQAEKLRAAAEEKRRQQEEAVARAKANTISSRGATPTATGKVNQAKGLRAQLEAAAEEFGSARV